MPTPSKASAPTKEKDRRKSTTKPSLVVTLRLSPGRLRGLIDPSSVKEESPVKESPATSTTLPNDAAAVASNAGDNASPSTPGTPVPSGTPSQVPMGPPSEAPKKKGVKRSAATANANDPTAKVRGKPGPKKKPRLDDGTIDPNGRANGGPYHKLGPKANQGAINAGLRALDRSGAPCRKWSRGGFRVKSFTGVVWEVSRWTAPPKPKPDTPSEESAVSAEGSNKENKDGSQMKSENSTTNMEGEQRSVPPSIPPSVNASSPAPTPIAAAS
ncbi:INO80 complex, subunit Ies4 [Biscogniauxia sp. FL1348]|nr:INO80 complex, subunit Ies4 [Biscogniauxia sp. FL1348]